MKTRNVVFLDRDGVINREILDNNELRAPRKLDEFELLEGAKEAINMLFNKKFTVVVVTNQPDISRGLCQIESISDIHNFIRAKTQIDHFYICPHDSRDNCFCRKPLPGLLNKASLDLDLNLQQSYMIGDRWSDVKAGQTVGSMCFYVKSKIPRQIQPDPPYYEVDSLLQAVKMIIGMESGYAEFK